MGFKGVTNTVRELNTFMSFCRNLSLQAGKDERFFSVSNKRRLSLPVSDLICGMLAEGSITFNERYQVALKGSGNKSSGGGKRRLDARIAQYSDAQRKKSKAIVETVKPRRKK